MASDNGRNRVLRAIVEDVKRSKPHPIDWERVEAGLMREIRRQSPPSQGGRWQPFGGWVLTPLVAAALTLVLAFWSLDSRREEPAPHPASVAAANYALNGDAVRANEVLNAETAELKVNHAGRARWTLAPGSSAKVLNSVGLLQIRLLSGSLRAEVVPGNEPERFVVEAADTRVAVHGTVFSVELKTDRTVVHVEHGVVAVGPLTNPLRPGALLYANDRQTFSLHGLPLPADSAASRRIARRPAMRPAPLPAPAPSSEPEAATVAPEASAQTPALPAVLTINEVEAGVSTLVENVLRCFREKTTDSGDVRVTARTSVTLEVAPDGSVIAATFSPPLSPNVQECSVEEAYAVRFAASLEGATITRMLELAR